MIRVINKTMNGHLDPVYLVVNIDIYSDTNSEYAVGEFVMDGVKYSWWHLEWDDLASSLKSSAYEKMGQVGRARFLPVIKIERGVGSEVYPLSKRGQQKFNKKNED